MAASSIYGNKIQTADIQDSAVTAVKIGDSAVTTAKINNLAVTNAKVANNTLIAGKLAPPTSGSSNTVVRLQAINLARVVTSEVVTAAFLVRGAGTVTVAYEMRIISGSPTANMNIYLNSTSPSITQTETGSAFAAYSHNITVGANQVVGIRFFRSGATGNVQIRNLRVTGGTDSLLVLPAQVITQF